MATETLSQRFHAYLEALAESHNHNYETVHEFYHAIMVVNGKPMEKERFHEFFNKRLSDLGIISTFVQALVIDEPKGKISARIGLRGRFRPHMDRKIVVVYEHNFYEWRNGKIAEVWNIRDYSQLKPLQAMVRREVRLAQESLPRR